MLDQTVEKLLDLHYKELMNQLKEHQLLHIIMNNNQNSTKLQLLTVLKNVSQFTQNVIIKDIHHKFVNHQKILVKEVGDFKSNQ